MQPIQSILGFKNMMTVQLCICNHHKNINLIILILLDVFNLIKVRAEHMPINTRTKDVKSKA
jgi:uncharacterized membrane protein